MGPANSRDELEAKLSEFSHRLEDYRRKKLNRQSAPERYAEQLIEFERAHEFLSKRIAGTDQSLWDQMAETFADEMDALRSDFESWAARVDDAYEQSNQ